MVRSRFRSIICAAGLALCGAVAALSPALASVPDGATITLQQRADEYQMLAQRLDDVFKTKINSQIFKIAAEDANAPVPPSVARAAAAKPAAVVVSAPSNIEVVPVGNWAADFLDQFRKILDVAISGLVFAIVPAFYRVFISRAQVEKWTDMAITDIIGAVRGQTVSVEISNAILKRAAQLFVDNESLLARWLGGAIKPKIISAMQKANVIPADTDLKAFDMTAATKTPKAKA